MPSCQPAFELRLTESAWAGARAIATSRNEQVVRVPVVRHRLGEAGAEFVADEFLSASADTDSDQAGSTVLLGWSTNPCDAGARALSQVLNARLAAAVFLPFEASQAGMGLARCGDGFVGMRALHAVGSGLRTIDLRMGLAPPGDPATARIDVVRIVVVGPGGALASDALRQLGARRVLQIEAPDLGELDEVLSKSAPDVVFDASAAPALQDALQQWCTRRLRPLAEAHEPTLPSIRMAAWSVRDMLQPIVPPAARPDCATLPEAASTQFFRHHHHHESSCHVQPC